MTRRDEVDRLIEVITVDCYNLAEHGTVFYEAFAEAVPFTATVLCATVRVLGIDIAEHGEELTARCQRGASWQACDYPRCLGLTAHPVAAPAG